MTFFQSQMWTKNEINTENVEQLFLAGKNRRMRCEENEKESESISTIST